METIGNITWEIKENIGVLSLGPPPGNLLADPVFVPSETLIQWTSDPSLKGIMVHGKGRHFSAGADLECLTRMAASEEKTAERMNDGKKILSHLEALPVPVVAAIQGVCFGGGLEIALACKIRLCAENALFAFPEVNHRVLPGLGGTVRLQQTVSPAAALTMILGGDTINAEEALRVGLVDRIFPREKLFSAGIALLQKMTRNRQPEVIHAVMNALRHSSTMTEEEAMREETRMFCKLAKKESERRSSEQS